MVGGNWFNNDGMFLQFGTSKAVATTMGDYQSPGEWRDIEFTVTLSTLSATAAIQGNTTFLPTGVFIESVQTDVEVSPTGASTLTIGSMRADRSTAIDADGFLATVTVGTAGTQVTYTTGVAGVGAHVGTTTSFPDGFAYITATGTGTPYTTGVVKVRIRYRGIGTITQ